VFITPRLHPDLNCGLGIATDDVAAALAAHPAAKLVALVSPSYCGVASDLSGIADHAHARGIPVYVDEAWGPHFHFHPALPRSAMASGVDGAVTSPHKLLACLSQGSVLHVKGTRIDPSRVAGAVGMTQTTSPLLPILAALDACRRQMAMAGELLLERTIELAQDARSALRALAGLRVFGLDLLGDDVYGYDPTKLVIDVLGLGLTGFEVERALRRRFGIAPEMSDSVGVICLVTVGDTRESVRRLINAFSVLSAERRPATGDAAYISLRSSGTIIGPSQQALSPREAFFARSRPVPLAEAVGEVAAALVVPYPPGIPILTPGELITAATVEYLRDGVRCGMYVSGGVDSRLETILVVSGPH
jgi:arginine/lysine/ornithine decarboxylase